MTPSADRMGLTAAEVLASRAAHGANVLTPPSRESPLRQFLAKFADPLIVILLAAGGLSLGVAAYEFAVLGEGVAAFFEPVGIFVAILLATGLSFLFERRAGREFDLLNQVNDDEPVLAVRDGGTVRVPKRDVVVGDVVVLAAGDEIPADGELLDAVSLGVDESTLTGEPLCRKTVDPQLFDPDATFPSNHVLRGTKVMEGHGTMRVLAVGDATESGRTFVAAQIDNGEKTPLDEQLEGLARVISRVSYVLAALVLVGRLVCFLGAHPVATLGDLPLAAILSYALQSLMLAVTLVVVSVPEGLPMAVTLSLALSMRRMLKAKLLVRRLHACETMGATTVICTDKTGTLTQNQMRVQDVRLFGPEAEAEALVREGIAVNSTAALNLSDPAAPQVLGNPTEGALLLWLHGRGVDGRALRDGVRRVDELPFSTERKYMATVVDSAARPGRRVLHVKGAPEIVFGLCASCAGDVTKPEVDALLLGYQRQVLRTLGFAYKILDAGEDPIAEGRVTARGLVFLGVAAIADPVRADVPAALAACRNAGIAVKIVTGDTPATAREIARQVGLWTDADSSDALVTGPEFAAFDAAELARRARGLKIIARARPLDKKRLVEALRLAGDVVAVTGDGTNDAPALKAAHVGLSMGDGTSVAKEASDVTIVDNSFASIARAVMWGRSLYRNIQRFILFQLTVNVVACLTVLIGSFFGTQSPLTVTQMLWVNLIMDTFAAMAMASLPPSEEVMKDAPRARTAFILTPRMRIDVLVTGIVFTLFLTALLAVFRRCDVTGLAAFALDPTSTSAAPGFSAYELSLFFTAFVLLQFWNIFNVRTQGGRAFFDFSGCGGFLTIALLIFVGQVLIVSFGGRMFGVVPLALSDWVLVLLLTSLVPLVARAAASCGVAACRRGANMI